jgi:hypothetical protein
MSVSFATWFVVLVPMPLIILLCLISYLRHRLSSKGE